MNHKYTDQDIQNYLNKRMLSTMRKKFEKTILKDDALRERVHFFEQLNAIFIKQEKKDLKNTVKDISNRISIEPDFKALENLENENNTKLPTSNSIKTPWRWVAGILIIASIGFLIYKSLYQEKNIQINQEEVTLILLPYKTPFENLISYDINEASPLVEGLSAYDRQDYKEAILKLSQSYNRQANTGVKLYWGLSLFYDNQFEEAIKQLLPLAQEQEVYSTIARFYTALAYLETKNIEEAEIHLKQLENTEEYRTDARRIFRALEKIKNKQ